MSIEVRDITKTFGGLTALRDCSLTVEPGTITGLIGPNGAGKTTLFNIVAGAFKPDSGQVLFEGADITGLGTHRLFRRGIVRTFQVPNEFSRMTVRENLMLVPPGQMGESLAAAWFSRRAVRRQEEEIAAKVEDVLAFLNLDRVASELAGGLSGGQKKLLELGRTMMTDAKMVLLDEPGAGVNRSLLVHLIEAIERLKEERGYTFCIIEHDMNLIERLCYPVIAMVRGEILASGAMEDIRSNQAVVEAYFGNAKAGDR